MELDKLWAWVREGGWMMLVTGAVIVTVVAVVAWLAWPQIKPKPKPQPQSLETVVPNAETEEPQKPESKPVPKDVVAQIVEDLGEDQSKMSIHWAEGAVDKEITVRIQRAALDWEEMTYVEREGRWVQK